MRLMKIFYFNYKFPMEQSPSFKLLPPQFNFIFSHKVTYLLVYLSVNCQILIVSILVRNRSRTIYMCLFILLLFTSLCFLSQHWCQDKKFSNLAIVFIYQSLIVSILLLSKHESIRLYVCLIICPSFMVSIIVVTFQSSTLKPWEQFFCGKREAQTYPDVPINRPPAFFLHPD